MSPSEHKSLKGTTKMTMAIVRLRDTRTLVGLFAAESREKLATIAGEFCAPSQCEYTELPQAGLFATRPADLAIQSQGACLSPLFAIIEGLSPTVDLERALVSPHTVWTPLDPDANHPASEIDALLASPRGRAMIATMAFQARKVALA